MTTVGAMSTAAGELGVRRADYLTAWTWPSAPLDPVMAAVRRIDDALA